MPADLSRVLLRPEAPIFEAIEVLETSHLQVALVIDGDGRLVGTVTDGDVRRGILRGVALDRSVDEVMHRTPHTMAASTDRAELLSVMRRHGYRHMPLVDEDGRLVGLETLDELLEPQPRANWVVLMAGGRGTRLRPLTENVPKPMLEVGGRPILETSISRLADQGFRRFFISVHYLADKIKAHFGDGERFGASIDYLHEDEALGTAGCLSLLPARPDQPIIVMNGDVLTDIEAQRIVDFHTEHGAAATLCVREYDTQIPYGVVEALDHRMVAIEEKPIKRYFVNAGIYVIEPAVLDVIERGERLDMPELLTRAKASAGDVLIFPIREYWVDVGRVDDFVRASDEFTGIFE